MKGMFILDPFPEIIVPPYFAGRKAEDQAPDPP